MAGRTVIIMTTIINYEWIALNTEMTNMRKQRPMLVMLMLMLTLVMLMLMMFLFLCCYESIDLSPDLITTPQKKINTAATAAYPRDNGCKTTQQRVINPATAGDDDKPAAAD